MLSQSSPIPIKDHNKNNNIKVVLPNWVPILYSLSCFILIPWTIFLGYKLPHHYISSHWDITWVGFDVLEISLFALTAILTISKSAWVSISSGILGSVLIIDAWFDILTARAGRSQRSAIMSALFIEVPLGLISLALSFSIFRYIKNKSFNDY